MSNVIQQYQVTYDSEDRMFIVHREAKGKPNIEFRMHKSGLHYYDLTGNQSLYTTKLTKDFNQMKKYFTQLQQLQDSDSDLSNDDEEEKNSHFQISDRGFQLTPLNQESEPHIAKLFNQALDFNNKLDLR